MFKQSYLTWSDEGPFGRGGGGSCGQFTANKDGKLRITTITFRVLKFTENSIVNEEQIRRTPHRPFLFEVIHLSHDDGLLFSLFYIFDNR